MQRQNKPPQPPPLFHGSKKNIMEQAAALTLSFRQAIVNVEGQQQQVLNEFQKLKGFIEAQMETIKTYLEVLSNTDFIKQTIKETQQKTPEQQIAKHLGVSKETVKTVTQEHAEENPT